MRLRVRLAVPVIALLVISACRAGAVSKFPAGTFVTGEWGVTFSANNTYQVTQSGRTVVEGGYTVGKDGVIFKDTGGQYACYDSDGKYTWKIDNDSLTFVKIDDNCQGRIGVLTSGPLTRPSARKPSEP